MNFNRKCLLLVVLLASGCGGGGGYGGGNGGGSGNAPPPQPANTSFTSFIKTQLARTSDTAESTEVNDQQFDFDENEASFDDVLQQ